MGFRRVVPVFQDWCKKRFHAEGAKNAQSLQRRVGGILTCSSFFVNRGKLEVINAS